VNSDMDCAIPISLSPFVFCIIVDITLVLTKVALLWIFRHVKKRFGTYFGVPHNVELRQHVFVL
jgi:hypothetical protein